jgi:proton glutamate symport protein
MARTSVNVLGNCLATAVIARWEGEFNPEPEKVEVYPPTPQGGALKI